MAACFLHEASCWPPSSAVSAFPAPACLSPIACVISLKGSIFYEGRGIELPVKSSWNISQVQKRKEIQFLSLASCPGSEPQSSGLPLLGPPLQQTTSSGPAGCGHLGPLCSSPTSRPALRLPWARPCSSLSGDLSAHFLLHTASAGAL